MREGRHTGNVVGLALFLNGIGSKTGDPVHIGVGLGVVQEASHVGRDAGSGLALAEGHLSLLVIGTVHGLGEPDLVHQLSLQLPLEALDGAGIVVRGGLSVHGVVHVSAGLLHVGVQEVLDGVVVGTAVDFHGAVSGNLGHLLAGVQVLVPGPLGGQFAQAGLVPGGHVDGDVVGQTAAGEGVDAAVVLVAVEAPLLHQVDALGLHLIGDVLEQAVGPALISAVQAEGGQHVHFAAHDGGVHGQVAVGVVVVGVQVDLDVGVGLVELSDHGVHAGRALEGDPEIHFSGHIGVFFQDPVGADGTGGRRLRSGGLGSRGGVGGLGVRRLGALSGAGGRGGVRRGLAASGQQGYCHQNCKHERKRLFHDVSSDF